MQSNNTNSALMANTLREWEEPNRRELHSSNQRRHASKFSAISNTQSIKIFADVKTLMPSPERAYFKPSLRSPVVSPRSQKVQFARQNDLGGFNFMEQSSQMKSPTDYERSREYGINNAYGMLTGSTRTAYSPNRPLSFYNLFPETHKIPRTADEMHLLDVDKNLPQAPYHCFNRKKKMLVVCLVSFAALLDPLSASIFFPAVNEIARVHKVSVVLSFLVVSMHMLSHGIAPLLWMPLTERFGRRLIIVAATALFAGVSIGLLFIPNNFYMFLALRCLQSVGSSSFPLLAGSVVEDIATGEEAKSLMKTPTFSLFFGILIGPVISGVLLQEFGLFSIFWFLFASGALLFLLLIVLLPETNRSIAGNGSRKISKVKAPLICMFKDCKDMLVASRTLIKPERLTFFAFIKPLSIVVRSGVLPSLLVGSVVFGVAATVIATAGSLFQIQYRLSPIQTGLIYLPSAVGSAFGFCLATFRINSDYKIIETRYLISRSVEGNVMKGFPIERARLRSAWWIMLILIGTTAGFGFAVSTVSIARSLILHFFIATNASAFLVINTVLISDTEDSLSMRVGVNFFRFLTAAAMIGTIQLVINILYAGLTFAILAGVMLLLTSILFLQWIYSGCYGKTTELSQWGQVPPNVGGCITITI